ncbi:MAG: alpha-ketoglutarate-dependent dioxygenase AlkB [Gammaproteobacteria bacterium]|nr:alpha-ketoglutarate-dependent dioxygenase AlkB [Gammaproteobacteria bacterium]MYB38778.1 alpha-ketoglutarate-dependent dioxygenase AlkB [Gammaproteobacteria bacterium]
MAKSARDLASKLNWPCLRTPPIGGKGSLFVAGRELPVDLTAVEWLDHDEFRRQLAIEAGEVPDPPRPPDKLPGFAYLPNFITAEEEDELLQHIDDAEWSTELKRRVQHYGWRYDYGQRQIDESMRLGELPFWADKIAKRLVAKGLVAELPDQVIVNEYCGKQGISPHVDQPKSFAEPVATVSLLESWGMKFRRRGGEEKTEKTLERRSVAVLSGDARYKWTHEIPSRKTERVDGKRIPRERRISLTFRKSRIQEDATSNSPAR